MFTREHATSHPPAFKSKIMEKRLLCSHTRLNEALGFMRQHLSRHGRRTWKTTLRGLVSFLTEGSSDQGEDRGGPISSLLEDEDAFLLEGRAGVPMIIARTASRLFYALPPEAAESWPESWLSAIGLGAELETTWSKYMHWLLSDPKCGIVNLACCQAQVDVIKAIAALFGEGCQDPQRWAAIVDLIEQFPKDTRRSYSLAFRCAAAAAGDAHRLSTDTQTAREEAHASYIDIAIELLAASQGVHKETVATQLSDKLIQVLDEATPS